MLEFSLSQVQVKNVMGNHELTPCLAWNVAPYTAVVAQDHASSKTFTRLVTKAMQCSLYP